jgi:FkbM family methyltransferase
MQRSQTLFARARRKLRLALDPSASATFVIDGGLRLSCPLRTATARMLTSGYRIESNELDYVRAMLQPGDTFIDIGANVGLFTLTAARTVGPGGRVFAFEPSSRERAYLERNIRQNGFDNVVVAPLALSDAPGELEMLIASDGGLNSFARNRHPEQQVECTERVAVETLDRFVERNAIGNIRLIKIDVEGAEHLVIAGAGETLRRRPPPELLCEFCDDTAAGFGSSGAALYDAFVTRAYSLFELPARVGEPVTPAERRQAYGLESLIARVQP